MRRATPKIAPPRRPDPSAELPAPEALPQVIILGRTNVGKSTLFNRVIGGREAIVHEQRGVTRDRLKRTAEWSEVFFALTDQAGFETQSENPFASEITQQIDLALREADVIWLVVDRKAGITAEDRLLAQKLHPLRSRTPILLVANKVDDPLHQEELYDFYELGFGDPYPISALHGRGIDVLLDDSLPFLLKTMEERGPLEEETLSETGALTFAILGKQNVGKSSLFNQLIGSERAIVSDIAGTTRDAIDARFTALEREFCSIDTAGLKRRTKIETDVDFYAMRRAEQALTRADVAVLVLDVSLGVTDLDKQIGGLIRDSYRACVIVANKWDLSEGAKQHRAAFEEHVRQQLHYLFFAPVIFTSALEGTGVAQLLPALIQAQASFRSRMTTGQLNALLEAIWEHNPPQSWKGRRGKIFYGTQVGVAPPHVVLQVNSPTLYIESYRRYLYHALHAQLNLPGSPIRISYRGKTKRSAAGKSTGSGNTA